MSMSSHYGEILECSDQLMQEQELFSQLRQDRWKSRPVKARTELIQPEATRKQSTMSTQGDEWLLVIGFPKAKFLSM